MIDRDTKRPEIFRLAGSQYVALQADGEGWLLAETMRVRFRGLDTTLARLSIEDSSDPRVRTEI